MVSGPARSAGPAPQDVRTDLLQPSDTTTRCPYKGTAHYWSLRVGQRLEPDIVWSYPEPGHDADAVPDCCASSTNGWNST